MLEIHELDDVRVVPDCSQELRPRCVGGQRREALAQDPVVEQGRQSVIADLLEQLVLAARHGEDDLGAPLDRARERRVGGGVARMQRYDHVGALALEERDVADFEAQALVPKSLRERLATLDHVLLQVEPDDLDVKAALDSEQVVEREGQVRLAGAEVDDPHGPVR